MSGKIGSSLEKFKESVGNKQILLGIDVHKNSYSVCLLCGENNDSITYTTSQTNDAFVSHIHELNLNIQVAVYEAGPTGFPLAWAFQEIPNPASGECIPVHVVGPNLLPRPTATCVKNDKKDAQYLAELCLNPAMLKRCSIAVPTRQEQMLKEKNRWREDCSDEKSNAIKKLKAFYLRLNINVQFKTWTSKVATMLRDLKIPDELRKLHENMISRVEQCDLTKKTAEKELKESVSKIHPELFENIKTIPGIAGVIASVLIAELFNVAGRFSTSDQLAKYCGVVPTIRESGEKTGKQRGYMSKSCNIHIQRYLIEAAWALKNYDDEAEKLYNRKYSFSRLPQKAIASVAKRVIKIVFRIFTQNIPYFVKNES